MATYVLVHGAWGGGWSWNRTIAAPLRAEGHTVLVPTLTGLGERSHLASPEIGLDTHVQDVANVLFYEDVRDVVLVGHSYGGMVVTGAADRERDRLRHLVYLDAFVPEDGQSLFDLVGPERAARQRAAAAAEGDGWRVPPNPPAPDTPPGLLDWSTARRGWQPIRTFEQPVHMTRGPLDLPRTYVYCSRKEDSFDAFGRFAERLRGDPAWRYHEIATGHNLQYSAPEETLRVLRDLA